MTKLEVNIISPFKVQRRQATLRWLQHPTFIVRGKHHIQIVHGFKPLLSSCSIFNLKSLERLCNQISVGETKIPKSKLTASFGFFGCVIRLLEHRTSESPRAKLHGICVYLSVDGVTSRPSYQPVDGLFPPRNAQFCF